MTTGSVVLEYNEPVMLVGALESRTRLTVRAAKENAAAVYILPAPNVPYAQGFPLYPGEAYTFDGEAARVAVYGLGPWNGYKQLWIITEGA